MKDTMKINLTAEYDEEKKRWICKTSYIQDYTSCAKTREHFEHNEDFIAPDVCDEWVSVLAVAGIVGLDVGYICDMLGLE